MSTIETIEIEINTIEMTEIMEMITLIEEIEVIKTRWVDKETEMIIIGLLVIKDGITHIIISEDEYLMCYPYDGCIYSLNWRANLHYQLNNLTFYCI